MRNFIVSDLHGNGYVYDSIINFLTNIEEYGNDSVCLYVNGDLIDIGINSGSMLVDIFKRIEDKDSINIEYLAGNHEQMLYKTYLLTKDLDYDEFLNKIDYPTVLNWIKANYGYVTRDYLLKNYRKEDICKLIENVGYLNIYHKFNDLIDDKEILLVHACPIRTMNKNESILLNENSPRVDITLNVRREDVHFNLFDRNKINIIGHTANFNFPGFLYDKACSILNIDGGSKEFGYYENRYNPNNAILFKDYDEFFKNSLKNYSHVPLVEIDSKNNRLNIFIFNHLNEIIDGYYLIEGNIYDMESNLLNSYRNNLKENVKVKKRKI